MGLLLVVMLDMPCSEVECKITGDPLQSTVSPSLPLLCVTGNHQISIGLYHYTLRNRPEDRSSQQLLYTTCNNLYSSI